MGSSEIHVGMTRDRLLIKKYTPEMLGRLYLPTDRKEKSVPLGKVVCVGPGLVSPLTGELEPISVPVREFEEGKDDGRDPGTTNVLYVVPGMDVYFLRSGAVTMELNGVEYLVVHAPQVVSLANIKTTDLVL